MTETLLIILAICIVASIGLQIFLSARKGNLHSDVDNRFASLEKNQEKMEKTLREESAQNRKEISDSILSRMSDIAGLQKNQLDIFASQLSTLTQTNDQKLERMRETVEKKLTNIQEDNSRKLEQMRATVDEKLHATLEQRLGESFKLVSERLELVHKGLGEMQALASGVGDLKKMLANVKARGTWGEVQLGNLLEQIFSPEQYAKNVATKKGSNERVEYAVKLPGRDGTKNSAVWLPIDAKFPVEDYQKLAEAQDQGNLALVEEAGKMLEARIKSEAKGIREKYLDPPNTTDFGIMYLPLEGLYAEVLRRPGLCELLQRDFKVNVSGPTTLTALLNALQMGFRTLAVEKRSSEVWTLLSTVKTEFGKFGDMLEKTQKKLQEASNTIEDAAKKSRTIEKKLNKVQALPVQQETVSLPSEADDVEEEVSELNS